MNSFTQIKQQKPRNILETGKLRDILEENRIRWFGHVMNTGEERLRKMGQEMKVKRKNLWEDLEKDLKNK